MPDMTPYLKWEAEVDALLREEKGLDASQVKLSALHDAFKIGLKPEEFVRGSVLILEPASPPAITSQRTKKFGRKLTISLVAVVILASLAILRWNKTQSVSHLESLGSAVSGQDRPTASLPTVSYSYAPETSEPATGASRNDSMPSSEQPKGANQVSAEQTSNRDSSVDASPQQANPTTQPKSDSTQAQSEGKKEDHPESVAKPAPPGGGKTRTSSVRHPAPPELVWNYRFNGGIIRTTDDQTILEPSADSRGFPILWSNGSALPDESAWTLSIWFRFPRISTYGVSVGIREAGSGAGLVDVHADRWTLKGAAVAMHGGPFQYRLDDPTVWHHLVVERNAGNYVVWIDGGQITSFESSRRAVEVFAGNDKSNMQPDEWTLVAVKSLSIEFH